MMAFYLRAGWHFCFTVPGDNRRRAVDAAWLTALLCTTRHGLLLLYLLGALRETLAAAVSPPAAATEYYFRAA